MSGITYVRLLGPIRGQLTSDSRAASFVPQMYSDVHPYLSVYPLATEGGIGSVGYTSAHSGISRFTGVVNKCSSYVLNHQGNLDEPLNAKGEAQAKVLAKRLANTQFDQVYSSDLSRAYNTAKACFAEDLIQKDERLREINFGDFQRRRYASLSEDELTQVTTWLAGPAHEAVPGGESANDLQTRARDWLASLPETGRVIAFAHGGIIATILYVITGRPSAYDGTCENTEGAARWRFRLGNTSISKLVITKQQTVVLVVNDNAHLETLVL